MGRYVCLPALVLFTNIAYSQSNVSIRTKQNKLNNLTNYEQNQNNLQIQIVIGSPSGRQSNQECVHDVLGHHEVLQLSVIRAESARVGLWQTGVVTIGEPFQHTCLEMFSLLVERV
jgi:hypothetical protein